MSIPGTAAGPLFGKLLLWLIPSQPRRRLHRPSGPCGARLHRDRRQHHAESPATRQSCAQVWSARLAPKLASSTEGSREEQLGPERLLRWPLSK
jgi:hypothetical protein